ncbi:hypothetical protein J4450_07035 [Candidatus Micrarchaeota archaeon]|nr:hypothetical protein [Candidatus Micrarchaeota archaeon]
MADGEFSTLPGAEPEKKIEVAPAAKPVPSVPAPSKGNFARNILIALIIVVIIIAGVAAYMGYVNVPGITPKKDVIAPTPTPVPQPPPPPEEEEEMPPPLPDE